MMTVSEVAVTITIWLLTLAALFFGGRAAWRRWRQHVATVNTLRTGRSL